MLHTTMGRRSVIVGVALAVAMILLMVLATMPAFAGRRDFPRGEPGTEQLLVSLDVAQKDQGRECVVRLTSGNQKSTNPNSVITRTGSDEYVWGPNDPNGGPETIPNVTLTREVQMTMGSTLTLSVLFGETGVMSAEVSLAYECPPPEVSTITIIKTVINNNDGTAEVEDFALFVGETGVVSGEAQEVEAGTYTLKETQLEGYTLISVNGAEWDEEALTATVAVGEGEDVVVTFVNDDDAPPPPPPPEVSTITIIKTVINNNDGTAEVEDFALFVGETGVVSGEAQEVEAGTYTLKETQLEGYTLISVNGAEWDEEALTATVAVGEGEDVVVTFTNDDNPPPPPPRKIVPPPPPIIITLPPPHEETPPPGECELVIVKTPDVETARVGDLVTWTLTFENVGDAKCTGNGTWIRDPLDTRTEFVSAFVSAAAINKVKDGYDGRPLYESKTHTVNWNAGVVTPGESGWVSVTVRVREPEACGGFVIENVAMITSREYNLEARWHVDGAKDLNWVYSETVTITIENDCPPDTVVPGCADTGFIDITRGDAEGVEKFTVDFGDGVVGTFTFEDGQESMRIPLANGDYVVVLDGVEYAITIECGGCPTTEPDFGERADKSAQKEAQKTRLMTDLDRAEQLDHSDVVQSGVAGRKPIASETALNADVELAAVVSDYAIGAVATANQPFWLEIFVLGLLFGVPLGASILLVVNTVRAGWGRRSVGGDDSS